MRGFVLLLLAATVGCTADAFVCSQSEQCDGGVCEPNGYCSYDDEECDSGRRYGEFSGPVGGQCVEPSDAGSSSTTAMTGTSGTSGTTESASTTAGDTSTSTSSGSSETDTAVDGPWWNQGWSRRQLLTFDATQTGADVSEVPVLIRIDGEHAEMSSIADGGVDIRFVAADQTTVLVHEEDESGPPDAHWVWLRLPLLPAGGEHNVWLYYGNVNASPLGDGATVWDESFVAVWHFGPKIVDRISGAEPVVNEALPVPGQIGSGLLFGGVSASVVAANSEALTDLPDNGFTMTAWVNATGFGGSNAGRIVDKSDAIQPTLGFSWQLTGQNNYSSLQFDRGGGSEGSWIVDNDPISLDQWHFVAVTHADPGPPTMYVDGQRYSSTEALTWAGPAATDGATPVYLGNRGDDDREFEGVLDEVRISNGIRSEAWITVQHLSGVDELVTFGPVENRP